MIISVILYFIIYFWVELFLLYQTEIKINENMNEKYITKNDKKYIFAARSASPFC